MLYWLVQPLGDIFIGFNVFRYLTFRTGLAIATAFFLSLVVGPWLISRLRALQVRQAIRKEGPDHHQIKEGTPTMGGLLIIGSFVTATLLWADLENPYIWTVLLVTLGYAAIGLADDWLKVRRQQNLGLTTRQKLLLQVLVGLAAGFLARAAAQPAPHAGSLALPFFKDVLLPLGFLYVPFVMVVLLVAIFTGAIAGAALGFLWFNCHPAQIFMGDVGSLALGAGLGIVAVVAKQELLLLLVGGLFVLEALSVLIQVISFKTRGIRVFRMAPLHHHFELLGWTETQVVVRFWIIAVVFALAGLSTLKLR